MKLDYPVFDTILLVLMILIYVVTYVHIVTSDFHDIGHGKNPCRAALAESIMHAIAGLIS